jgi:hypothetical protein
MTLKQKIKSFPRFYGILLEMLNIFSYFEKRFNYFFPKYELTDIWKQRIDLVKSSPDNAKIKIVNNAGVLYPDHQLMHNGLKITLGSYYDYGNTVLLRENKGVHEPQEEYVFQEVLKILPSNAVMMELGSFWAFYSMWFLSALPRAKAFMVEPDPHKMNFGKLNFKLNNLRGVFDLGFISDHNDLKTSIPTLSVDYLVEKHNIDFLHVLHCDIQGYELKMLHGANSILKKKKVGFVFISTHSNQLHNDCEKYLQSVDYSIICSANLDETYSWDGLIVAQSSQYLKPLEIEINKKI